MTRIINDRAGSETIGNNPIPRSELRRYLYAAARDSYQDYEACPWWRPLHRAYLRGLSDALYDAWTTYAETERNEAEAARDRMRERQERRYTENQRASGVHGGN